MIATLRGLGGALHPLNAGLVGLGWYGVRQGLPGAWRRLLGLYGLAVGLHALWNGGLRRCYCRGLERTTSGPTHGGSTCSESAEPGVVLVFMLAEVVLLWRLLVVVSDHLREPGRAEDEPLLALHLEQPRRLAVWAGALVAIAVPIGALYGPLLGRYASSLAALGP